MAKFADIAIKGPISKSYHYKELERGALIKIDGKIPFLNSPKPKNVYKALETMYYIGPCTARILSRKVVKRFLAKGGIVWYRVEVESLKKRGWISSLALLKDQSQGRKTIAPPKED